MKTEDPNVPMSHTYASRLHSEAKDLRMQADNAAWNLDMDIAAELERKARWCEAKYEELIMEPNVWYPLF